jgi:very-short-patch-repair endonuclease
MSADPPGDCARLLKRQRGVIARWQAPTVGLSPAFIDAQLRRDRWQPLYRGVYAAYTGTPPREAVLWAGILRAGPGAVLSHHSAAELDGLADSPGQVIHVTVSHGQKLSIPASERDDRVPAIAVHQSERLDIIRHPARTPPRTRIVETVLDLTQTSANFDDAFSWLSRGCGRRLVTPQQLCRALNARARMRWRDEILAALDVVSDGVHSNLEYRYVRDVERPHGLPRAKRQVRMLKGMRSQYLDNLYESFGVGVELDGRAYHRVEDRWRDIRKDNASATSGIVTLRFSWTDVTRRPCSVAAAVAGALQQRGWPGPEAGCSPGCTARRISEESVSRID